MEIWAWRGADLVGFAVLQLFLYRYFIGESTASDPSTESTTPQFEGPSAPVERPQTSDEDIVTCEECGTPNRLDPSFTFCKSCGSRL
jgi:hypothetical protein